MQTVSVVGPTQNRWGQTLAYQGLLVAIEMPHEEQTSETGHDILQSLQNQYDEIQPQTLAHVELLVKTADLPPDSTIVLGCIIDSTLYVAGRGQGTVYVYRNNQWAPVFINDQSISGPLAPHDRIFFCTPSLIQAISEETLAELAQPEDLTDVEEDVAALLHQSDYADGAVCLIVEYASDPPVNDRVIRESETTASETSLEERKQQSNLPKKKITVMVGTILALLLMGSLVFGTRQRARAQRAQQLEQVLGAVTTPLDEGTALVDVNPNEARDKLLPVQEKLEEALKTFPENSVEYKEIVSLMGKTNELLQKSERKHEITEPAVFMDIHWIKEGAQAFRMHRSEDLLVFVDREQGALYSTSVEKKNYAIVAADSQFKQAIDVVSNAETAYALLSGKKVVNENMQTVTDAFENNSNPVALEAFNDNLYALDTSQGILKLPKTDSGFGSPRSWFENDVSLDFSDAKDLAIDGSIWVITNDNVIKFTQGGLDSYSLQGGVITTAKALYTDADSQQLYILENDRIVVFDKKGAYQEQYVWSGFADATDIIVLDDTRILVLRKDKVYQIDTSK